jgi:hypothetical protein
MSITFPKEIATPFNETPKPRRQSRPSHHIGYRSGPVFRPGVSFFKVSALMFPIFMKIRPRLVNRDPPRENVTAAIWFRADI